MTDEYGITDEDRKKMGELVEDVEEQAKKSLEGRYGEDDE